MSSDREIARIVEDWLSEDETRLPDRVLDAVLDRVPVTRRRRAGWLGGGFTLSSPLLATGLTAAAAIIVALVGLTLLQSAPNIGVPDPSSEPSPTLDETSDLQFWSGRELPAGTYVIGEPFPARITMTVPDGWTSFGVTDVLAAICNNDCEQPDRVGLGIWVVRNVYADACDVTGVADPPVGPSVADLVEALGSLPRHQATEPQPATVGGRSATYLELTADAELGDCARQGFRAWTAGSDLRESPPGERNRLWVLDVDGQRIMVDLAIPPGAQAADVEELVAVVESLRIEPLGD